MEVRDVNGVDVLACLALSIDVSKYASCGVREERLLIVGLPTQIMPECNHRFDQIRSAMGPLSMTSDFFYIVSNSRSAKFPTS
jgi:hypothetical protein